MQRESNSQSLSEDLSRPNPLQREDNSQSLSEDLSSQLSEDLSYSLPIRRGYNSQSLSEDSTRVVPKFVQGDGSSDESYVPSQFKIHLF